MENLIAAAKKLFISKEYSDFTIICNGRRYHLHKSIVCPQSDVFAAQLRSAFKEGQENSIDLSESDATVVHCMIRYLYGFGYTADDQFNESGFEYFGEGSAVPRRLNPAVHDFWGYRFHMPPAVEIASEPAPVEEEPAPVEEEPAPVEEEPAPVEEEPAPVEEEPYPPVDANAKLAMHSLMIHAKVYIIADMYDIPGLKKEALQKFKEAQSSEWDANEFVQAAEVAYTWTRAADSALRDSVLQGFMVHQSVLTEDKWKAKLMESGEMLYDIARSLAVKGANAANAALQQQYRSGMSYPPGFRF